MWVFMVDMAFHQTLPYDAQRKLGDDASESRLVWSVVPYRTMCERYRVKQIAEVDIREALQHLPAETTYVTCLERAKRHVVTDCSGSPRNDHHSPPCTERNYISRTLFYD